MEDHEMSDLLERAAPTPAMPLDVGAIERRAHRLRRPRTGMATVGLVAVGVTVAVVALLTRSSEPEDVIAGEASQPGLPRVEHEGDRVTIEIGFLDGTRLDLTIPEKVGADIGEVQLAGSVYAERIGGRGWPIYVVPGSVDELGAGGEPVSLPDSSPAAAARLDREERRLWLQFGSWVALISLELDDHAEVEFLVDGIELAETTDGFIEYRGSLPLWVVDSPNAHLRGGDLGSGILGGGPVSVFFRECSEPSSETSPAGLTFTPSEFHPARGTYVAVLCDVASRIEIWLDTAEPLSHEEIAQVDVALLTVGSTLSAVQDGRHQ